ncbi:MAG: hypothetical protein KF729_12545 [Sandaracinaceae bacterium]|nr:hypothetical protein [Sandaracinaceae bacterium]
MSVVRAEAPAEEASADPYVVLGWSSRAARPGLSAPWRRRARLVAEALFSTDDGPPPAARLDWLEEDLGDFFGHLGRRSRLVFVACLATIYFVAPLLAWRLCTLGALDWRARVHAIERLERSALSIALLGAKAILSIVYFEHPDAAREIGWTQQCKLS